MHSPYTSQPLDALTIAQTSVGLTLTALAWARPLRSRVATYALVASAWVAIYAPIDPDYLKSLDFAVGVEHTRNVLRFAAVLAAVATILSRRWQLALVGVLGAAGTWWLRTVIQRSDWEIAATVLGLVGLILGVHYRLQDAPKAPDSLEPPPRRSFVRDDLVLFALTMATAAVVSIVVLHRHNNSGDEVANTYQAALFAKGHAYDAVPACAEAFRSFWVFQYEGRSFAQYTPGWPLFMAPFVLIRAPWLAGPASLGVLAVGVARLSRRAAAGFSRGTVPPSWSEVRTAGILGSLTVSVGAAMLINGASRYPHVFVAAMFAWSTEALLRVADGDLEKRGQWLWGGGLGLSAALMLAARPADGATLGIGLFAYFVYAMARRRVRLRSLLGCVLAFAMVGGLTLVILRLQLGVWFKTGYFLGETTYAWSKFSYSPPQPDEVRVGIPIASGSYCWWPCAPALGLAGLAALRGRAQRIAFILFLSSVASLAFLTLFGVGRHNEFSFGPRFQLPIVVPMAVGGAVVLAKLWHDATARSSARSALRRGGPFAVAMLAAVVGVARIAPLIYPEALSDVRDHNRLPDALAKNDFHNAVILAAEGISNTSSMDVTENLPLQYYPDQDILIARDLGPASNQCVRDHFPNRTIIPAVPTAGGVRFQDGRKH